LERWRQFPIVLLVLLINGLLAGAAGGFLVATLDDDEAEAPVETDEEVPPPTVSEVVEDVSDTVVTVVGQGTRLEGELVVETQNVGSGVILREDGFIVTNQHVVAGADELDVILASGERLVARLVGDDSPFNDLAVLKVAAGGLPAATIGDSDLLMPGQPVVVIGQSPLTFAQSVSSGVVSGLHRRLFRDNVYLEDLIQTDAAINQGNSGGALFNLRGELVGMPTSVLRTTDGTDILEGVAFAISSRTIADIAFQLINDGSVRRPTIGIETQTVTVERDGATREGAVITAVDSQGPAAEAGLIAGDVILSINGNDISGEQPFLNLLKALRPEEIATLEVSRNSQIVVVEVEVVENLS
jgi:S1-C subfamily serine protease